MRLKSIKSVALVIAFVFGLSAFATDQDVSKDILVEVANIGTGDFIVVVSGLSEDQIESLRKLPDQDFIKLWVNGVNHDEIPDLAGEIVFSGNRFYFKPDFPLKPGMKYESELSIPLEPSRTIKKTLVIPASDVEPTKLVAIYPSAGELPENLLKFYVHFSGPMRKGDIYQFIHLRERIKRNGDVTYREIELPFLEIEQEFWSVDSLRLTLLLDPGRIKRGLKPREEMGPIFEADKEYELVIDGSWPDANGNALVATFNSKKLESISKVFKTIEPDQSCPNPGTWKFKAPKAGTRNELVLNLDEPLDSAMLRRVIEIRGPDQRRITGEIRLLENESVWKLRPDTKWEAGRHEIHIDNRLEDLCGNSISKLFDVDVFEKTSAPNSIGETVQVFEVE